MAARKTTSRKPAKTQSCPDCQDGQVLESFKVGARRKRVSNDRQEALCLTCWGTGTVAES